MASTIDITKPEQGNATTQSVRDNFAAAKTEIEALQADLSNVAPDLVSDLTPQLGGNLDANGHNISMGVNSITDPKVGWWDQAHGWGDHSAAGYLTTETDPTVPSHVKSITTTEKADWNTAYGWGSHGGAGYYVNGSTGFNSTGIDDNATSTAITIDANENVGIGYSVPDCPLFVTNGDTATTLKRLVARFFSYSADGTRDRGLEIYNGRSGGIANSSVIYNAESGASAGQHIWQTDGLERMRIDSNGSITATGTLAVSGGNSTNWNTAYSWGNPSSTVSPAVSTTTALDFTDRNFIVNLNQATTFSFTNLSTAVGKSGMIVMTQDATGGRTFTLPAQAKTPLGGATIAQHTAALSTSVLSYFVVDSSTVLVNYIGDYA